MSDGHRIIHREDARRYVTGGNAIVTLVGKQRRLTFRIQRGNKRVSQHLLFVSVLTGPSNESDYTFLGTIFPTGNYRHSRKSRVSATADSARAWSWFWNYALNDDVPFADVEVWHHGRCSRCGRLLTDNESVARGLGPVCAERVA